ncbi:MAG: hypothetical protein JXR73_18895 [Candidatus Omnitrophica bacterium]|nr:hypothetical protein [Candidatus Omnitrophota bacterium]
MTDSAYRKDLEKNLIATIRKAQSSVQSNPKLQKMAEKIRSLYQDDQENVLNALGAASSSQSASTQKAPPASRIPELLYLLNETASLRSASRDQRLRKPQSLFPSLLKNLKLESAVRGPTRSPVRRRNPFSPSRRHPPAQLIQQLEEIEFSIQEAQTLLSALQKEEDAVCRRMGKYANVVDRLKAERLLRELPGSIAQMRSQKQILEEQIQEMINPQSEQQ